MPVQIINPEAKPSTSTTPTTSLPTTSTAPTTKLKRAGGGHQKPATTLPLLDNDLTRVRIRHWLALLGGLSASAFYARLDRGSIPEPCGRDPRPFWRAKVVREFLAK